MSKSTHHISTIGHSTHSAEKFLELLGMHHVQVIADVRSSPYSQYNPQFNRETLERFLNDNGIQYVFLGDELGARSDDPACYEKGRVQYTRLAQTPLFLSGIDRVVRGAAQYRVALMCAEKEPLECHRTLLVGNALAERGENVVHIHADGHLETHENAMERLLDLTRVPKEDLFKTKDELVSEALARQEKHVAYVDKELAANAAREGTL